MATEAPPLKHLKTYGPLVLILSVIAYVGLFVFVTSGYTGNKVLPLRNNNRMFLETVLPESWLFFSKSPAGDVTELYQLKNGRLVYYNQRPFTARYAFGLNRSNRIAGFEIKNILDAVARDSAAINYHIMLPKGADINNYVHADTLRYNTIPAGNAYVLKGDMVIAVSHFVTWQGSRTHKADTVTLIPVHLPHPAL